jgi:hypothetical protein
MKLLTFLFILGSLSIGCVGGMAFMAVFYKSLIKDLRAENRKLRSINARLKRSKKDTIEIIYPQQGDEIDFSQRW